MIKKLRAIIAKNLIIDIYLDIENNGNCVLVYEGFRVVGLDIEKNLFLGYKNEDREKIKTGDRIITEDNISLICKVVIPSEE